MMTPTGLGSPGFEVPIQDPNFLSTITPTEIAHGISFLIILHRGYNNQFAESTTCRNV